MVVTSKSISGSGSRQLPLFQPGPKGPQTTSARDMNELVRKINALLNLSVHPKRAGKVDISDANVVIDLQKTQDQIDALVGAVQSLNNAVDIIWDTLKLPGKAPINRNIGKANAQPSSNQSANSAAAIEAFS